MCSNSSTIEPPTPSNPDTKPATSTDNGKNAAPSTKTPINPSSAPLLCSCAHSSETKLPNPTICEQLQGSLDASKSNAVSSSLYSTLCTNNQTSSNHSSWSLLVSPSVATVNVASRNSHQLKSILIKPESISPTSIEQSSSKERCGQTNKRRCWQCRVRIGLTAVTCRCGFTFCVKHRYSEEHNCTFNYKNAAKRKLELENPRVVSAKVARIN